jgi:Sulfite exporter TauE/SafE
MWIALLGTLSGLMIGCIGIGGVILVPALVFLAGVAIEIAIPAAMFAYILSGLAATVVFARNKSIDWRMASSVHRRYAGGIRWRVGSQYFRWPFAGWLPGSADPFVGIKFAVAANSH